MSPNKALQRSRYRAPLSLVVGFTLHVPLVDFSKIEADKLELEHSRFLVDGVVANALTLLQQRAYETKFQS